MIGSTINSSGNTAIHYDAALPSINGGNYIRFSSTGLNVKGLPSTGSVKLYVTNASISFPSTSGQCTGTFSSGQCTLPVPYAVITFSSTASSASTTWDATNSRWSTLIPMSSVNGNATIHTFFDGVAFPVPSSGFPTGIQSVTWQAAYSTSTTGLSFNWQWGAAVYSMLPTAGAAGNYSSFGVNPLDSSVPAGTPVNYETNLVFGDTGAGYTGLYANFVGVVPTIAPMSVAPSSYDFGLVPMGNLRFSSRKGRGRLNSSRRRLTGAPGRDRGAGQPLASCTQRVIQRENLPTGLQLNPRTVPHPRPWHNPPTT
jgi:hypothetical protein